MNFTSGSKIYRSLIALGLPILIGQVGMILVMFADNIMIGHYSTEALASVSFVNNLFNMANMTVLGFSYGITPLIGALFAKGLISESGALMRSAALANIIYALLISAIMAVVYLNLHHFTLPENLYPIIRPYFLITLAGILPISLFNSFAQWSYAIGNSRIPMWFILGANALNVIGNYMLIFGHWGCPEMGLTGAGISTLAARWICAALMLGYFFRARRNAAYALGFHGAAVSRRQLRRVTGTSFPVAMQMALETGAFSFAAVVTGILGEIPLASFQVIVIVGTLGFCIYYSIGAAVSVLVSNACGISDARAMRRVAWRGYHIILFLTLMASLTFLFFGKQLVEIVTDDPRVIELTLCLIFPLVLYQVGDATQINFANALRGTGRVTPMVWIAFVSYLVVGVPATWFMAFSFHPGIYGVVLSFSVSLFLAGALFLSYFLKATRYK